MKFNWIICLFLLVAISCSEDSPVVEPQAVYDVAPEFESYVQEFIAEGAKRGETIDFSDSGLSIKFSEAPLNTANGRCFLGRHQIEIDKEDWFSFSALFRSYLLFHELGHCELDRLHKNDQFSDGSWKSILKGDPFAGEDLRKPVPYFGFRKDYYIDELFNSSISDPEWADVSFNYTEEFLKEEVRIVEPTTSRLNERFQNVTDDYELELTFDLMDERGTWTTMEWGATGVNYYIQMIPDWGYYIGVRDSGMNNILHYRRDLDSANGRLIDKITIRQSEGFEQVFVNEEFIFHLDQQSQLDYVSISALIGDQIVPNFNINKLTVSTLK